MQANINRKFSKHKKIFLNFIFFFCRLHPSSCLFSKPSYLQRPPTLVVTEAPSLLPSALVALMLLTLPPLTAASSLLRPKTLAATDPSPKPLVLPPHTLNTLPLKTVVNTLLLAT